MSIDFTKPLQTREGRKVRLLCTDAAGPFPVVCLYEDKKELLLLTRDGKRFRFQSESDSPKDLMNVPEQVTMDVWVNIYDRSPRGHPTKEDALRFAGPKCRATLHIKRSVPVGHVDED